MPNELAIRLFLRSTARISSVLFLLAFAGPSLYALWPSNLARTIKAHRPHFLLAFAGSHTLHLAGIVLLALAMASRFFAQPSTPIVLAVGGTLYVFIYALAFSAFRELKGGSALLPERFATFAMYALWVVFTLAFVPRTAAHPLVYGPLAFAAVAVLVVRVTARLRVTRRLARAVATGK